LYKVLNGVARSFKRFTYTALRTQGNVKEVYMLDALGSAVSGMDANAKSIKVNSNNVANLNTTGFKASHTSLADAPHAGTSGGGTLVNSITPQMTQGTFMSTGNPLDMAIDGGGFFTLKDQNGAKFFSRDGSFSLDAKGNVVNPQGMKLQGLTPQGALADINVSQSLSGAGKTSGVDVTMNLNSESPVTGQFSLTNGQPSNYNFSSTQTLQDSQGGSHDVTSYFSKTAPNTWEVNYVTTDSATNTPVVAGKQTLGFNTDGSIASGAKQAVSFDFGAGVAPAQSVDFNYGGSTQLAAQSQTLASSQNGYSAGSATGVSVDSQGFVNASFTNGRSQSLGQVALSRFGAPQGLTSVGHNLYTQSGASGSAMTGSPGASGLGGIVSGSLEQSNVDLAGEFVNMISSQRAFKANTKTVQVNDEMTRDLLSLKA
jgi:flagellar hook protein FlgE